MIQQLKDLPANCVGFRATDEVSKADFIDVVIPAVEELIARTGQINYMLVLDTSLRKFTAGAWLQDALMGLKHLAKWHRAAIITDLSSIQTFTAIFSAVIPGEFKGFDHADYNKAVAWVSETN